MARSEEFERVERIEDLARIGTGKIDSAAQVATAEEHSLTFREACKQYPTAVFWAMAISLTIVMEGYDTALIGNLYVYPSFQKKYGTYYPDQDQTIISGKWQVALGNGGLLGSIVGLIIYGYAIERFGHRIVIMVSLVFMSGFIFISFFAPNVEVLEVGMVLCGIPWGIFAMMGPAYASEVCPLALRGYLTSFVNICWVIGQFIASGVLDGLVNNTTEWSFRVPFGVQWVWPVPLFAIAYFAPDSPWWLTRRGRLADAEHAIRRLSSNLSDEEIRLKLAMIVQTNNLEKAMKTESSYLDCFRGTNLRRTEIACFVLAAQSVSGQPFAYSNTYFFIQAGLSSSNAYKLSLVASAVAFVGTCVSWVLMAFWGRRTLILAGLSLMSLSLLLIGILAYPAVHSDNATWAQAALTVAWLGLYSATLGPQSFGLAAEISATRVRSQTISLARNFYNVVNICGRVVEPYLINPTEANLKGKTAFVWFGLAFCMLLWAVFRLPETRGITYGELDVLFEKRVPAWRFSSTNAEVAAEHSHARTEEE